MKLLPLILLLAGCATCERHPIACSAAVGFVATSVALSVNGSHSQDNRPSAAHAPLTSNIQPVNCANGGCQ